MTNVLYVASLVLTGVLVLTLAVALLTVLWLLRGTAGTLGRVGEAMRAVADRTAPIGDAVTQVNVNLSALWDTLRAVVPPTGRGEREASRSVGRR